MLPAMHQACAETTGALWSSRRMSVRPLSSVAMRVPNGQTGMLPADRLLAALSRETVGVRIVIRPQDRTHYDGPQTQPCFVSASDADTLPEGRNGLRKASWKS